MGPIIATTRQPYAALGGESAQAETSAGNRVRVWAAPSTAPLTSRYFCHGEALRTFQLYGYTIFSGPDLDTVLADEYFPVARTAVQREDILAWMGPPNSGEWISTLAAAHAHPGFHPFVRCHTARVIVATIREGEIDENHTLVRTKNGVHAAPGDASLRSVVGVYGAGYSVYRWRKKVD